MVFFWDIDGTLLKTSLENHFLFFLLRKKHISLSRIFLNLLHLSIQLPLPNWYQIKAAYLRNLSKEDIEFWANECWRTDIHPSLYPGSVKMIQNFHHQGIIQVLLSGTLRVLAAPLAKHLGFKHVITGEAETNNGKYSGSLVRPHPKGLDKVASAEKWLKENKYEWDKTAAAGDHWADRFLFDRVSKAIVIRPGRRLKRLSMKKGWSIINNPESTQEFLKALK